MKENKLIKILIPIVAMIVVLESVILVSNLDKGNNMADSKIEELVPTEGEEKDESPVADFVFATDTKEMKVGKSYEVVLNLVAKKDLALDAIETYVDYDPKLVTVSKLVSGSTLPKADVSKIDEKNGKVSVVFLIDEKAGYVTKSDEINKIVSFMVTPKVEGQINLELTTSSDDKKLVTMIVETATSKQLTFSSNKLEINAIK